MPWAVFHKSFDFDFRPAKAVCQHVEPSGAPQEFTGALIDAAVAAGAATRAKTPTAKQKRAGRRVPRAE